MLVEKIVVGALATNCYIIAPGANSEAAVIDPGADGPLISEKLKRLNLRLKFIISTHGHCDHIGAASDLSKRNKVPVYIHAEDISMLNDSSANLSAFCGAEVEGVESIKELSEGQVLKVGELALRIIYTPGHTKGSISVMVKDKLFTGDLLFQGSVGRTDFAGSSFETLLRSLQKISELPDDTLVCPGHGPETNLGEEKQNNPFFREICQREGL